MNRKQRRASRGSLRQRRKQAESERHERALRAYAEREEVIRRAVAGETVTVSLTKGWGFSGQDPVADLRSLLERQDVVVVHKPRSLGPTGLSVEAWFAHQDAKEKP